MPHVAVICIILAVAAFALAATKVVGDRFDILAIGLFFFALAEALG